MSMLTSCLDRDIIYAMDTQAMSSGGGTTTDIQAQRDAIPPMQVTETKLITDALKVELKQIINEVLDERERA